MPAWCARRFTGLRLARRLVRRLCVECIVSRDSACLAIHHAAKRRTCIRGLHQPCSLWLHSFWACKQAPFQGQQIATHNRCAFSPSSWLHAEAVASSSGCCAAKQASIAPALRHCCTCRLTRSLLAAAESLPDRRLVAGEIAARLHI
jgi:hypothetical protein